MSLEKPQLTVETLQIAAGDFAQLESAYFQPALYGVDNGKTIGTYLEQKFHAYLGERYTYNAGNSASGIDLPGLGVDIKTTSIKQPQSSCPFHSARQKIYGLGYSLLLFVYEKTDLIADQTSNLDILHTIFVEAQFTGIGR